MNTQITTAQEMVDLQNARPIGISAEAASTPVVVTSHRQNGYYCAQRHWPHGVHGGDPEKPVLVNASQLHQLKSDTTGFISVSTLEDHMSALGAKQKAATEALRKQFDAETKATLAKAEAEHDKTRADLDAAHGRIAELEAQLASKGKR